MRFFLIPAICALAGCSTDALIDRAYPDRQKFKLYSEVAEEDTVYLCDVDADAAKTEARVQAAHRYFEGQLDTVGTQLAEEMIALEEAGKDISGFATARNLNARMESVVLTMDARFGCLPID